MNKLKLVTTESSPIRIIQTEGADPVLAVVYSDSGREIVIVINKGGSPISRLVKCSELKELLSKYFIKGTKFIASTYNPTLYYLFPDDLFPNDPNSIKFTPDNNFIPTLPVPELVRGEEDWFSNLERIYTQKELRSIKVCDDWYNNPTQAEDNEKQIDSRLNSIYSYYGSDIDYEKESELLVGDYSANLQDPGGSDSNILSLSYSDPQVVSLLSSTSYTDTINLEDWYYSSNVGEVSGKLDLSFMYSINGKMYGGSQTLSVFKFGGNVFIDLEKVRIEYIDFVLKIYPVDPEIDEVIFNDCILTIGNLNKNE